MEEDFQKEAITVWEKSSSRPFHLKTKFLSSDLQKWRKKKPNLNSQLQAIEDSILKLQSLHPNLQNNTLQRDLIQQHQVILDKQAEFHKQRYKKLWVTEGDRNTHFFQQSILKRARRNRILFLTDKLGNPLTTQDQIASCFNSYFTKLFTSQVQHQQFHYLPQQNRGDEDLNSEFTRSVPDKAELWAIIKNMRKDAAPGPDGFDAAFYRASWDWLGDDVVQLVQNFYSTGILPPDLNKTFVVLIPKKNAPVLPQDFRPISLCNVIYKIIAKSLADRIKPFLPNKIHASQAAFIPGRHISSNIIIAQEITHSFGLTSWKHKCFLLKIDLAKAFDRIEWNFITNAMLRIGLPTHIVNLISACISTTDFSVLVNGQSSPSFLSQRGIRQGCPLSPYLLFWQ